MAVITRYVNTLSSAGGDGTTNATEGDNRAYADAQEWETAQQQDLDTGNNIALCYLEGATDDDFFSITGWTTSATDYIDMIVTDANRTPGKWDGDKYLLAGGYDYTIIIAEENVRLTGLQATTNDTGDFVLRTLAGDTLDIRIRKCNFTEVASSTKEMIYLGSGTGGVTEISNCLLFDGRVAIFLTDADVTYKIYNNTIVNMSVSGIYYFAGTEYVRNNLVDCANAFTGTFTDDDSRNDYNLCTQDADDNALGSHGGYNKTFAYVNEGANDFHLHADDTVCVGAGQDLKTASFVTWSDDIDGDERPDGAAWAVGMDELVAAGGDVVETAVVSLEVEAIGTRSLTFPLSAIVETEAVGVRKLLFPLSATIEVEAALTRSTTMPLSVLIELEAAATKHIGLNKTAVVTIEVEGVGTRHIALPLSVLVEVEAEGVRELTFSLSTTVELEAVLTRGIKIPLTATVEVGAVSGRQLAMPLSSLIEMGVVGTAAIGLQKTAVVTVEVGVAGIRQLTLPLSVLVEMEAVGTMVIAGLDNPVLYFKGKDHIYYFDHEDVTYRYTGKNKPFRHTFN